MTAPEETKEERNRKDRIQMLDYCRKMKAIKASQIAACQEVLRLSNCCVMAPRLSYQDMILNFSISSH